MNVDYKMHASIKMYDVWRYVLSIANNAFVNVAVPERVFFICQAE